MSKKSEGFHFRSFLSLLLFLIFSISALSGLILYLRPEGSLASWVGWKALGIDKKHWEGLHAIFVFTFVIVIFIHLGYNWKSLTAYWRNKKASRALPGKGWPVSGEFLLASAVVCLIFIGTICQWPPFTALVDLRTAIKSGRFAVALKPPQADTERLTIAELCVISGISEPQVLRNAAAKGIQIGSLSETLGEVAEKNHVTPEKLFGLLKVN